MAGLFGLSVNLEVYRDEFLKDLFWGIFYQQHLGQEEAGLAVFSSGGLELISPQARISATEGFLIFHHKGLVRAGLGRILTGKERGELGIAYCGPDTKEPILIDSHWGKLALCFTGNLINFSSLKEEFPSEDEVSLLANLITQGKNLEEGLEIATQKIVGSFTVLILSKEGIVGYSSDGRWPLVIGEKPGAIALATSSAGFRNFGFKLSQTLTAGEMILVKNGQIKKLGKISSSKRTKICSFLWVYTSFPNEVFLGVDVSLVRKILGASLARKDIEKGFLPDVVMPVPDSGRYYAIGYHQEFVRAAKEGKIPQEKIPLYDELLLKYPFASRSFTPIQEQERKWEAHIKIVHTSLPYQGKKVVVLDDSIVRGNQFRENLIPKIKATGVKEVHIRIGCPMILSYCPWGKTTKEGELFAEVYPDSSQRQKYLDVESLVYNTVEDLIQAIMLPKEILCFDCYYSKK